MPLISPGCYVSPTWHPTSSKRLSPDASLRIYRLIGWSACLICRWAGPANASIWACPQPDPVPPKSPVETFLNYPRDARLNRPRRYGIDAGKIVKAAENKGHSTVSGWRLIECLTCWRWSESWANHAPLNSGPFSLFHGKYTGIFYIFVCARPSRRQFPGAAKMMSFCQFGWNDVGDNVNQPLWKKAAKTGRTNKREGQPNLIHHNRMDS